MRQWCVRDVMTETVVSVPEDAPYKEVAETLARHRVSALPVVRADGSVIGVVSEADLLYKLEDLPKEMPLRFLERKQRRAARAKAAADAAGELMSSPAVVIRPDKTVTAAAQLMDAEKLKRLPVVDADGRLVGIVSRSDLLRIYLRDDARLRDEIVDHVFVGMLWIDPNTVDVSVARGVATLDGTVDRRSTKELVVRLVSSVAGVVDVVDNLTYDYDDTADLKRGGYLMRPGIEDLTS